MDYEKQKDEVTALESIYNKEEFSYNEKNNQFDCTFNIFVNLPTTYYLTYKDLRHEADSTQKVQISYLPPLTLHVILPEDYPSISAPVFTLCSSWLRLSALAKLCKKLDLLWENSKQEILFTWVEFLQNETLKFLKIKEYLDMDYIYTSYKKTLEKIQILQANKETGECHKQHNSEVSKESTATKKNNSIDKRAILECPIGRNPIQVLVNYNEQRKQIEFKKNFYTCNICFTDKSGEHCTQFLPCAHTFCKDCIRGYFEVRIKEGNVQNICCPEEKCKFEATPGQIKDLVSSELFSKYDSILLSATLDTMTDIVYCPRRHCQYPVTRDLNDQMAKCPVCQYAFCVRCKMVYHGVEPCKISSAEKQRLVNEYQSASNEKKAEMEQRYGKKQLQTLIENTMSENWINDNSHNCPHCKSAIEKSDGCNKMTCSHCGTYFCWLCGMRLNPEAPYLHFRNPESKCFDMLYRDVIPDEPDDDDDFDHAEYLEYYYYTDDGDFYDEDFYDEGWN
ncbi:E3 ubiquitin-protein ligase RNF14 [Harpegnathos saltator]|uniref:E3 ubiquitin-protein ligase RNF14 n=1 Tax=Harpegnathos saltator TaxID=610380 RepID=UPI000590A455|nr:E3 ubiquitin-protein ligase RNF14 [Harpegnathos saltator]XP_011151657.1 E3 ubiquitin-protein ligase RNF14 [Harpegnathos saltator]